MYDYAQKYEEKYEDKEREIEQIRESYTELRDEHEALTRDFERQNRELYEMIKKVDGLQTAT